MPIGGAPDLKMPSPDDRAFLDRMPGTTIPVIRQPFQAGDLLPFWAIAKQMETLLFDRIEDPAEEHDVMGETSASSRAAADDAAELLRHALVTVDAPTDQLVRLGLG